MPQSAPIVILNGAPRAGKSSIVAAIQESPDRPWMNLGVDVFARHVTPRRWQPGIGLRPGEDRPDLQQLIPSLYAALYESIAAHSRFGLAVVADLGHHVAVPEGMRLLADCARRVAGLPALFVGIHAPLAVIMERRRAAAAGGGPYEAASENEPVPEPVIRWQSAVHTTGLYDLKIDTSVTSPTEAAGLIIARVRSLPRGTTVFERLASE
jgi:chloramphenicol 3-O phosphotransferase